MIQEGVLTKADFDFAQGVWDLLEGMKPDAQKAHKEMYGYYFSEITAEPLQTPWGEYRGGYVPAIADGLSNPEMAQKREQEELLHTGNGFMFPTTGKGFTISRTFYNTPLELDLRVIARHLDKVARFAYLEPTIKDVGRLLVNKRLARALNGYDQTLISSMLNPWLQRTAKQVISLSGRNPKIDRFFNGLRARSGMAIMFGNVVNSLQQITGFSLAALKVPPATLLRHTVRYLKNPRGVTHNALEMSPWMQERLTSQSYEMQTQIDEILLDPNILQKGLEFFRKHAYFLQQAFQNVMDPIIWSGAYDHAVSKGASQKDAVRYADEAVRTTQGSFAPEDLSGFEVQAPFVKLFTQFYSYFNMWANLLGTESSKVVREMGFTKASPKLVGIWFVGFALPAVVAELISQGLPDDEDEDGAIYDDWLSFFFASQGRSAAAMVPGVGQMSQLLVNNMDDKVYNDRLSISPALSILESSARGAAGILQGTAFDEEIKKREIRDLFTLLAVTTGAPTAPLARSSGYYIDVEEGRAEPENMLEYGIGLATGR